MAASHPQPFGTMCILSSPRAATAVCSVKSRRDGLIIAQHAVLGSEECVDQSRKGRLNHGSIACAIRNFLNSSAEPTVRDAWPEHEPSKSPIPFRSGKARLKPCPDTKPVLI